MRALYSAVLLIAFLTVARGEASIGNLSEDQIAVSKHLTPIAATTTVDSDSQRWKFERLSHVHIHIDDKLLDECEAAGAHETHKRSRRR